LKAKSAALVRSRLTNRRVTLQDLIEAGLRKELK